MRSFCTITAIIKLDSGRTIKFSPASACAVVGAAVVEISTEFDLKEMITLSILHHYCRKVDGNLLNSIKIFFIHSLCVLNHKGFNIIKCNVDFLHAFALKIYFSDFSMKLFAKARFELAFLVSNMLN